MMPLYGPLQGQIGLLLVCLAFTLLSPCSGQGLNTSLTSTESTVTFEWTISDNATFYQVTWYRDIGIFFMDYYYYAPFKSAVGKRLTYSTFGMVPGARYAFLLYENGNNTQNQVYRASITTVPLPPENLVVLARTSTTVLLKWDAGYNSTQQFYKVEYQEQGTILTLDANNTGIPATFNVTNLQPGHTYLMSMRAVSNDKISNSSAPVTATTAPARPINVNVTAISSTRLNITWEPGLYSLQNSYEVWYSIAGLVGEQYNLTKTACNMPPCEFDVQGEPGQLYVIAVYAKQQEVSSLPAMVQHNTDPESVAALQKVKATTGSITVNWTAPLSGNFNSFQLGISANIANRTIYVSKNETEHTYSGLLAGENYTIGIRTVLRNQFGGPVSVGAPVQIQCLTRPKAVTEVLVETLGTDSLKITWKLDVNTTQNRFVVHHVGNGVTKEKEVTVVDKQKQYEVILDSLSSGYTYNISIFAVREIESDVEESDPQSSSGTTAPLPVVNVNATENNQLVTITWNPGAGSRQSTYLVLYRPTLRDPNAMFLEQTTTNPTTQFSGVFPGEKYEISVYARSDGVSSRATNTTLTVAPLAPSITIDNSTTTTTEVIVKWSHNPAQTYVEYWLLTYSANDITTELNVNYSSFLSNYEQPLKGLIPGLTYSVDVVAKVLGAQSPRKTLLVTTMPVINTMLTEVPSLTNTTALTVAYSVRQEDIFDKFRFTLQEYYDISPWYKEKNDNNTQIWFYGLNAGTIYTVDAVTISNGVQSQPLTQTFLTNPNNVKVGFKSAADTITINFMALEGKALRYEVKCSTPSSSSCWDDNVPSDKTSMVVTNLLPYTNYTFTIVTVAGGPGVTQKSVQDSYQIQTIQAAPSEVRSVRAQEDGLHTVHLSWVVPMALNGELKSYFLKYSGSHAIGGNDEGQKDNISPSQTTYTLSDLKAGFTYSFQVQALTVALGPPGRTTLKLTTGLPVFAAGFTKETSMPTKPEGATVGMSQFSVELVNAFTDTNGPITGYAVIVSKDNMDIADSHTMKSWKDARGSRVFKAYQATEKCPDLFQEGSSCGKSSTRRIRAVGDKQSILFLLGAQTAEECQVLDFCNGPLDANTEYYVKLRAFTDSGFVDTAYSSPIKTAQAPVTANNAGTIIGVVIAVILALIIVGVVIIFVIRRKRCPKRATKYMGTVTHTTTRSNWETSNMKSIHHPIPLSEFLDHVRGMGADSDFKYAEEYEELKEVGRDQPCLAAELPVNRPKNRFTNILPYDHSRVKLLPTDDEEGSDYINANYMPGYSSKREYIATQGPLPATRDDLWRMVWEQNTRNIVMLTKCMEKGREKSDHYWPADSEPKFYGDLQVVIMNETHLPDWTITEFRVCLGDICRQVRHFHYKAWPDFGVPKNHCSLIRFVRMVREKLIKEGGPIVTHCSAGVGRSGTYIVLDHCLQLIKEKTEIDIFTIVYNLRKERVLMVQTEQQYKFVHECIAVVMEGREDEAIYANIGQVNIGFEDDDEGINVEVPT